MPTVYSPFNIPQEQFLCNIPTRCAALSLEIVVKLSIFSLVSGTVFLLLFDSLKKAKLTKVERPAGIAVGAEHHPALHAGAPVPLGGSHVHRQTVWLAPPSSPFPSEYPRPCCPREPCSVIAELDAHRFQA